MTDATTRAELRTIGIIGAGEVGTALATAALAVGYRVVIANSRGPETLVDLVRRLGPGATAATAEDAARAGDFVIVAAPLTLQNRLPTEALAGKVVVDTNNYMAWRDGRFDAVERGELTEHEIRQQHLPESSVVKAFTQVQAPRLRGLASPPGTPDRHALAVSSDHAEAAALVARFQDEIGFDTVEHSPLSESWRSGPGHPAWNAHAKQNATELAHNLAAARDPRRQLH